MDPLQIDLGFATTTTKVQGSEFKKVIFWNNTNPTDYWTRSHGYVAVSRGKEKVWVMGTRDDFNKLCINRDKHRRTVFRELLIRQGAFFKADIKFKSVCPEGIRDPSTLVLMPKDEICCPTLEQAQAKLEDDKD